MTNTDITLIDASQSISTSTRNARAEGVLSLDQCVTAWIAKKVSNSQSEKTRRAYTDAITSFRSLLQTQGYDLDSNKHVVSLAAEVWSGKSQNGLPVSPGTYNQRRSILSSFYKYAILKSVLEDNPMVLVEGRKAVVKDAAMPLDIEQVEKSLSRINKKTVEGLRDYALLSLALTTGRRASELSGLLWKHVRIDRKNMRITWEHCKGNKQMIDDIKPQTQKALLDYLTKLHGTDLLSLHADQPIFVSFSKNNRGGQIGVQTVANICKAALGTSKVHATRHTFAIGMERAGASLSDIGARLGHANLKTTSDYMHRLHSADNKYATELEKMFGI